MMPDLGCRGRQAIGSIPGAEFGAVEAHAAGSHVQEGGHDCARIRPPIGPFALWQPGDALGDQPVVGPADEIHHRFEIGCARHRVE